MLPKGMLLLLPNIIMGIKIFSYINILLFCIVLKRIIALLKKDIRLELRQQHTFYGILLYIASTVFVLFLALPTSPEGSIWNSLFWVIQLFVCVNTVAKSFLSEGKGLMLYYYTIASPVEFIIAKLLYNVVLMLLMSSISLLLFSIFLDSPVVNGLRFLGIVLLGGCSISLTFSLMSAIAAKAQQNAALIAILGFPVILPQLMLLMKISKTGFAEVFRVGAVWQLAALIMGLNILVIALAIILFPFLWKE